MKRSLATLAVTLLLSSQPAVPVQADVRLPGFFTDHMVLQRDQGVRIWGWGDAGEEVTVSFGAAKASTVTKADGRWDVELPAQAANATGQSLKVRGKNQVSINDVLVGEVWLCSGQSNMEWSVRRSTNAETEIAAGNHPLIRHVKIPRLAAGVPQNDVAAQWKICTPENVGEFTAVGYFMARELQQKLNVPVGLINSSWGGTRIEPWTPPVGFAQVPALKSISDEVTRRNPTNALYRAEFEKFLKSSEGWLTQSRKAYEDSGAAVAPPALPDRLKLYSTHTEPTGLYNAMIHPLVGYSMRGAIWYQGESNSTEVTSYRDKMEALIQGWRSIWKQGDFPFYFVQLAPYNYGHADGVLPRFWGAQAEAAKIPGVGMAVISDIATLNDIHPPNKQDVGLRLAKLALKNTYGFKDVVDSGAIPTGVQTEGDSLVVSFKETAGGLQSRDGQPLNWFEIIGESGAWTKANAEVRGETIVLTAPEVKAPTAVRFAWSKLAEPNLMNGAKLPTSAFLLGEIPKIDFLSRIEEAKGYQLALDLDLHNLSNPIKYTEDHRAAFKGKIARIGYLLELQKTGEAPEFVFTSMDAFTQDLGKIGVPEFSTKALFQQPLANLVVVSNVSGVQPAKMVAGNIEFWPHNYGPGNSANVPGALSGQYDIGDSYNAPEDGHGSMQIHNTGAKQTVFAFNAWKRGNAASIGIGNSTGDTKDWTFVTNSGSYSVKRLRVFVKAE